MSEKRNRVLVIGLDGATFDLLGSWIKQDKLPNLKKLTENGVSSTLISTVPPLSPPAWVSFMTGKNPGKHGVFDFVERRHGSYDVAIVSSESIHGDTIWDIISDTGKKVGVVNVTVTYPPREVNGFMVSGMLTPSVKSYFTFPRSLGNELTRLVGTYRFDVEEVFGKDREDLFLTDLYRMTEGTEKATLYLMKRFDWDFFMVMFYGTELVQTKFWSYVDSTHPRHDPEKFQKYGNVILEYFQRIDETIGKILKNVDDDETTVVVMSDHGHGPLHKVLYVNRWLMELGLLKFKSNISVRVKRWLCKYNLPLRIYNALAKLGLGKIRNVVSLTRQMDVVNSFLSLQDVDWSRTKAYSYGHIGTIFVNLKGREPNGIVETGDEYEKLRKYIAAKLHEIQDPETEEEVVDKIFMKEDVYSGPHASDAPDILFLTKDMKYTAEFGSFGFHTASILGESILKDSGGHRMEGILIISGKNIVNSKRIANARIIDVAPTILYRLGVPILQDMDGRVLAEIFSSDYLKSNPILYEREKVAEKETSPFERSKREEEAIKERLRRLGYFG